MTGAHAARRTHTLRFAATPDALAQAAASEIVALLESALAWRGEAHLCLAGGSTPRLLHGALATSAFEGWPHVHVWFGDERCVPPDHPDSNAGMARETLIDRVPIDPAHVHRLEGELPPDQAAGKYDEALRRQADRLGRRSPLLDVLVLGMGTDGHTASIFPGSPLLDGAGSGDRDELDVLGRWCAAVHVPALDAWRLTLTPAMLRAAAAVVLLVTGEAKQQALAGALTAAAPVDVLPVRLLEYARGDVAWFVDAGAVFGRTAAVTPAG